MSRYNLTSDRRIGESPVRKLWTDATREQIKELAILIHFNDPNRSILSARHAACCLLGIEPETTR